MKLRSFFVLQIDRLLLLTLLIGSGYGQSANFFPLESLQPGMKGSGRTVFRGTQVEDFEVEILGVLERYGPRQSLIMAKLSGEKIEASGVFEGMSGSPVYIEEKLVGAIAYAFSFSTQPIAGITPIRDMIDVFKEHIGTSFRLAKVKPSSLYTVSQNNWIQPGETSQVELGDHFPSLARFGRLAPIKTPLNLAGFRSQSAAAFSGQLEGFGFSPVFGTGAASKDTWGDSPLEPGSTVAVQLVRGDMEVSASGTVTHVSGEKIYAFGHPFMGVGYTDLPLSKAAVLGVIPSLMTSQMISVTTAPIGSIKQDRATGIMGVLGAQPELVPVKLSLQTSRSEKKEFNYEVASDSFLTPFLLTLAVHNSIIASERSLGGQTLQLKCRILLKDQPEVTFSNNISDLTSSPAIAAITAASPVNFILASGFEDIVLEQVDLEITAVEQTRKAVLQKVWQDKLDVDPGEEVEIKVFMRKQNGQILTERYPVKIPEGLPPGDLKIMIGDGISVTKLDTEAERAEFIPENLSQLVRAINNLKKNDRLYIRLYRDQKGAVVAGQGLPGLPPSILALYNSDKTSGDTKPIGRVVFVEHELPATDFVLTGQKVIQVKVKG